MGAIFAGSEAGQRQYNRWKARSRNVQGRGLVGAALEHAILGLARAHPEYVVVG